VATISSRISLGWFATRTRIARFMVFTPLFGLQKCQPLREKTGAPKMD